MSEGSNTEIEIKMEMEDEFCATLENIKCEEEREVDIEVATLPEKYEVRRTETMSRYSEVSQQSNKDVSLSLHCRLCAMPCSNMVNIFSSPETEDILEKIQYSLRIMVTETDTLPKQICRSCLEELKRCYRFHKTVAEAEKQLHALDKLASMKSEEVERNDDFFPVCDEQHGPTEYNNMKASLRTTTIPEEAQISHATVKGDVSTSSWRPCAVWLPITESRCENNSYVENDSKSSSDTEDGNLSLSTEISNSGRDIVPEVDEQSICNFEVHRENPDNFALAHSRKQFYECTICAKTFKWKSHLTRHIAAHNNMEKKLELHKCNMENPDDFALAYSRKQLYECHICAKTFKWKSHLTRHIAVHNNTDKGLGLHKCNVCAKTFKWKSRLTEHSLVHLDKGLEPYKCNTCARTFKWKTNLIRHSVVHMDRGLDPHECNTCEKTFKWKSDLTKHNKIHTNKGLFTCEYCGKKFIKRTHRDRHHCAHTNEGPFKCSVCEKSFSEDSALKRHAAVHSEERNHPCTLCDKSFKTVDSRQRHMIVHTRYKV